MPKNAHSPFPDSGDMRMDYELVMLWIVASKADKNTDKDTNQKWISTLALEMQIKIKNEHELDNRKYKYEHAKRSWNEKANQGEHGKTKTKNTNM